MIEEQPLTHQRKQEERHEARREDRDHSLQRQPEHAHAEVDEEEREQEPSRVAISAHHSGQIPVRTHERSCLLGAEGQVKGDVDEGIAHAQREVRNKGDDDAERNVGQESHVCFDESSRGRVSHSLRGVSHTPLLSVLDSRS